jgi:hypothetical protein
VITRLMEETRAALDAAGRRLRTGAR